MRRKSFRLPCRTISERSGRRSGHSRRPTRLPHRSTIRGKTGEAHPAARNAASHHTTLRRAPPRQPHHDGRYPDLPQHRRYNTPAVPRYTAMHIAPPYRTASPPCRTTDDARPFVSQPDGRNIPTLLTDGRSVLSETKSNPRYIIPKKWLPLPRQGFRSKLRLTGINRERRAIRRQYLLL